MGNRDVPADFNLNDGVSETIYVKSHKVEDLLTALEGTAVNQVLVEAGPGLGSALMAAGVIDEVVIYQAPIVLGEGKNWIENIGVTTIADARKLTLISTQEIGPDIKSRYRVENR
jgi:diaminohydroxyphosphoribosylaminopyrimidine deaminase/5-amino-6-(5-phosphoribosylamino)uracil reductase